MYLITIFYVLVGITDLDFFEKEISISNICILFCLEYHWRPPQWEVWLASSTSVQIISSRLMFNSPHRELVAATFHFPTFPACLACLVSPTTLLTLHIILGTTGGLDDRYVDNYVATLIIHIRISPLSQIMKCTMSEEK